MAIADQRHGNKRLDFKQGVISGVHARVSIDVTDDKSLFRATRIVKGFGHKIRQRVNAHHPRHIVPVPVIDDRRAIFSFADGFVMVNAFPFTDASEDVRLFIQCLDRHKHSDRPPHRLGGGVAENAFRPLVPTENHAV